MRIHYISNLSFSGFFFTFSWHYQNLQVVSRAAKNQTHTGFTTIITAMGRESKANTFSTSDTVTQCLIMQWFDYAVLYVLPAAESKAAIENLLQVR